MAIEKIKEILNGKIIEKREGKDCIDILVKVPGDNSKVIRCECCGILFNMEIQIDQEVIYTKDKSLYVNLGNNEYIKVR